MVMVGVKFCILLKKLREKNKNNKVELSFLHNRKYYVKCNGKEGIIDVPQENLYNWTSAHDGIS